MTQEEVRKRAEEEIAKLKSSNALIISEIIEKPEGWVVYYNSEKAVKTGNFEKYGMVGNVPLWIGKDGATRYLPWNYQ